MANIVFDCERMKYQDTGIFYFCQNLGLALQKKLNPLIERVTFYVPEKVQTQFSDFSIIRQSRSHKFLFPNLSQYDIWHSTFQHSDYLPILNTKIKVILTIHDLNFLYRQGITEKEKEKCLKNLQNRINRADVIVCISDYCKQDVLLHCDIQNKPIYKIYNGVNHLSEPLLDPNRTKPQKPFLFAIGTVRPHKNFHAILPIIKENPHLEFIIAGKTEDHEYLNYIKSLFKDHNVDTNLKVIGPISEKEKSWYFNNCEAFVCTSLAEGFGLPVLEAMSVGKPVFLNNKTALPEIGGEAAYYFTNFENDNFTETFTSGMKQYHRNSETSSEQIKMNANRFCWEKAAEEYLKIYRQL